MLNDDAAQRPDLLHPAARAEMFRTAAQPLIARTMVRPNAVLFYRLAVAALLEPLAGTAAAGIAALFGPDRDFVRWLRNDWAPGRIARSHRLSAYIAEFWPEYDAGAAQDRFRLHLLRGPAKPMPASAATAALIRCATSAQSALFYRCLGASAVDVDLRRLAREMANDDEAAFGQFRAAYARASSHGGALSGYSAWRTARAAMRDARDRYVQLAFRAACEQWGHNAPFGPIGYAEFVLRSGSLVAAYGKLSALERLVFRPWRQAPVGTEITSGRERRWFQPVLGRDGTAHAGRPAPPQP